MTTNRTTSPITLEMFQTSRKVLLIAVLDADGVAVTLTGMTLRFVVQDENNPPTGSFDVENANITITGTDANIANVEVLPAKSATASDNLQWRLWDVTTTDEEEVLAHGPLGIRPAVQDVA